MYVLVMLFLAAGCATSGDIKTLNSNVQKIAKATAENRQFIKDQSKLNKQFTEQLGEIKVNLLGSVASDMEATAEATAEETVPLALRVSKLETRAEELESGSVRLARQLLEGQERITAIEGKIESWPDLRAYVARVKDREARHSFKDDPVEKLRVYFVGPFAIGQSKLTKNLKKQLKKMLAELKSKNLKVKQVDAFASITGTPARNKILSEARGKTVAAWLEENDVKVEKVQGLGGVTKFGRRQDNRCVVIFAAPAPAKKP